MLFGQKLKIYTDHKNLTRDALGSTSDRVYRWRLLLEEYGPEILYMFKLDGKDHRKSIHRMLLSRVLKVSIGYFVGKSFLTCWSW